MNASETISMDDFEGHYAKYGPMVLRRCRHLLKDDAKAVVVGLQLVLGRGDETSPLHEDRELLDGVRVQGAGVLDQLLPVPEDVGLGVVVVPQKVQLGQPGDNVHVEAAHPGGRRPCPAPGHDARATAV